MTTTKRIVNQTLPVRPWPIRLIGDEQFFGYVVGMGVMPDWDEGKSFRWVDFAYNSDYIRYELPNDAALENQLLAQLRGNMETDHDGMYGKVWIKLTDEGYEVDLP